MKKPAAKGRYTTGRVMSDVRHAIIRKGDSMTGLKLPQRISSFVQWDGPNGLRQWIKSMDERAAKRAGGPVKKK